MNQLKITGNKQVKIEENMFGIFFEDINYGADGGIYAEMIENRNFEFMETVGYRDHYSTRFDGLYGWSAYEKNGNANLEICRDTPFCQENPHYLRFTAKRKEAGFTNKSYSGLFTKKGTTYGLSFLVRNPENYQGEISVFLEDKEGIGSEVHQIKVTGSDWNLKELTFKSERALVKGRLVFCLGQAGTLDFDMISLFPQDAVLGIFRKDLAELLKELEPGFLRFPGGCIVEGNTWDNRYQWKESIGPAEKRKVNWNRWSVHDTKEELSYKTEFSHYNQTLGLGYFEYFLLCEYLGAKAVPVLNVGLACQYQSTELVSIKEKAFEEMIQDVLDLIEFANGDIDTKWGAVRKEMGHPASFNLDRVGIGNEQWETKEVNYFERYSLFQKRIHEIYPDMMLLSSAGPTVNTPEYDKAWEWIERECKNNPDYTYAIDEHYYMEPKWFYENVGFYDNYPRNVRVFAGEYAAHPKGIDDLTKRNHLEAAISEAAFMTGLERNADIVTMACYAPLFARIGYTQWSPDLIWFDDTKSYRTPSYYVQKFYSLYTGTDTLEFEATGTASIFYAPSIHENKKQIYIKIVNSSEEAQEVEIALPKQITAESAVAVGIYGESKESANSVENEEISQKSNRVAIKEGNVAITIKGLSFTVVTVSME